MTVGTLDVQGDEGYDGISEEDDSEDESASEEESEEHVSSQGQKANEIPSTVTPLASAGKMLDCVLQRISAGEKLDVIDSETARDISQRTSLLSFLPLDWLADISHVGCVLGILACDALADNRLHQELNKESLRVSVLGRRLLTILLTGCIAKKRYLMHHVINMDGLHTWLLSSCLNLPDIEGDDDADQLQDVSIELLGVLMRYTLKIASPMTVIVGFMKELIKKVDSLTNKLKDESKASNKTLKHDHSLLRICGAVMNVLEQVIAHKTSRLNEVKMAVHLFSQMSPPILALLQVITRSSKKAGTKEKSVDDKSKDVTLVLQDNHVLIDVYTAVIHVYCISQTSRKLSRSKEEFQELSWRPILAPFLKFAIDSIILTKQHDLPETTTTTNNNNGGNKVRVQQLISHAPTMTSSLHFLDVIVSSIDILDLDLPKGFHSHLLASILSFFNHLDASHNELKRIALDVVLSLVQGCSSEMVVDVLTGLSNELSEVKTISSTQRLSTCLQVWSMLLSGKIVKLKKMELRSVLPQVLMALQSILQQSTRLDLSILTLELMTKILSLGTSMIHSHHCGLVFHGSLLVSLDHNDDRFPALFQTQYSLLSTVLFHQSEAVYKAVHVFVTCVKNMLNSLCEYCNDRSYDKSKSDRKSLDDQLNCAEKMSRLYQEIATHKAALSKYVPYMVAEYIQQIQEVSLQEKIKNVLVPGIYCLIDSCGEHEIALLHAVLDKGSRELFTSLTNEYNKFYKFKGKA